MNSRPALHRAVRCWLAIYFSSFAVAVAAPREVVIPAADLAGPEQRAETPTPGRWWLNRHAQEWNARDGTILMTGEPSDAPVKIGLWQVIPISRFVPVRVPELAVDPKLSGWYRIYVGLYCDGLDSWSPPLLQGRLSGEPFPEYLQAPQGSKGRIAEAYWKSADLTGKQILISQPKAPMPHGSAGWLGGITHLRLVPMSAQEVAETQHERELPPPNQRLFAMLDTTDEIFWNGTAENEDDIRAIVYRHHEAGFGRIYWRTYYVSFFRQIASTGVKGIMIDLLRHPPIAGYEPIVTEAFQQKYGQDMESRDLYKDPQVQELFSEYFRAFLVELRQAVGYDLEISVRCTGPNNFGLRGQEWIDAGLINTIIDGHWYSGNGPRPTIDATVAAVGTKGKAMAAAESSDVDPQANWRPLKGHLSPAAIEALAKAYSGRGVAAFGLYESTIQTWSPEARRAIRRAGWNYDPRKPAASRQP